MTTQPDPHLPAVDPVLTQVARFPRMRVLAWAGDVLYASRGYDVYRTRLQQSLEWEPVARFPPPWWRSVSSRFRLAHRLFRDGFHALAVLPSGHLVGAVPGAIVTAAPSENEFRITHQIKRGTRPLHIASTPDGRAYWGEYFDNKERGEVLIYASGDHGETWSMAYTFPAKAIRHVHNVVYDRWENCLWILTGDYGHECRVLKASCDLRTVEPVLEGNQQARTVALLPTKDALYFASDTPLEKNYIYRLNRNGQLTAAATIESSSIYGGTAGGALFFSTMVEPSESNPGREVHLYGSTDGTRWKDCARWKKDPWPMGLFQYGNAFLPDGDNQTDLLAVTTVAVVGADLETNIWRISARAKAS